MKSFQEALAKLPPCCLSAYENLAADSKAERIQDLLDAVTHEMTLYAEDQDGCITAKERAQCSRYLSWLREEKQISAAELWVRGVRKI